MAKYLLESKLLYLFKNVALVARCSPLTLEAIRRSSRPTKKLKHSLYNINDTKRENTERAAISREGTGS